MTHPTAPELAQSFSFTTRMITNFIDGITDEAACVSPSLPANSLNWVVGHIVVSRQRATRALGLDDFLPADTTARYATGSPPVTPESEDAVPLSTLRGYLLTAEEMLSSSLAQADEEKLATVIETRFGPRPVGQHLDGLHWHETYHIGQLEILREVALQAMPEADSG